MRASIVRAWVWVSPERMAKPPGLTLAKPGRKVVERALEQIGEHEIGLVGPASWDARSLAP